MKIRVSDGDKREIVAVYFGVNADSFPYCEGDKCDIAFSLEINEYMGISTPQLLVKGMRISEGEADTAKEMLAIYKAAVSQSSKDPIPADCVPSLNDFREVFRYLRRNINDEQTFSLRRLSGSIAEETGNSVNICKIMIISDVLHEQGIAEIEHVPDMLIRIKLLPFSGKINLDNSALLRRIKANHQLF